MNAPAVRPRLPEKPSALIRLALADLAMCVEDPAYRIVMGSYWHMPGSECFVCLAGSVMAQTLHTLPHEYDNPEKYDGHTKSRLYALNYFRLGYWQKGLEEMDAYEPGILPADADMLHVVPYCDDSYRFEAGMERMAAHFESVGA